MCGFVGFFTNGYGGDRDAVIKAMADRIARSVARIRTIDYDGCEHGTGIP